MLGSSPSVPHDRRGRTAYLFDLDGTLTATELLPLIAVEVGLSEQIGALTSATMAGEVPFDASFTRRVELLGGVPVQRVAEIVEAAPVMTRLLAWIGERRDHCWVVTGNLDCWVQPWLDRHGLRGFTSTAHIDRGRVHVGRILRKESVLRHFSGMRTVMIGDGANDAQIISQADVGIACAILHPVPPVVIEVADYVVMDEEVLCRTLSLW